MKTILGAVIILSFLFQIPVYGQQDILSIRPSNSAPTIDGVVGPNEWKEAASVHINRSEDWTIKVQVTYDPEYLYIAFCNVQSTKGEDLNAEVLVQTGFGSPEWDANTYWFHASYGNCEAQGEYYNWEDCSNNPQGWQANTFPFTKGHANLEFRISFAKLNIDPPQSGEKIGIAFKLSSATELKTYWPPEASIEDPTSWGSLAF